MLELPDGLAAYMTHVIDGYGQQIAQTGAAVGHAVLFLTITADQLEAPHDSPIREAARALRRSQDRLITACLSADAALDALTTTPEEN